MPTMPTLHAACEGARRRAVCGETGRTIAEWMAVDQLHGSGQIGDTQDAQHRPEDFFAIDGVLHLNLVEDRGAGKKPALMTRHLPARDHRPRASRPPSLPARCTPRRAPDVRR